MDNWTSIVILPLLRLVLPGLVLIGVGTYIERRRSLGR
jgi:hypothetical protein